MPNRTAKDIMIRSVVVFSPDTDIYAAMRTLLSKRISGAPVIDSWGCVQGILSEKDCFKVFIAEAIEGAPHGTVGNYMSSPVETVTPATSLYEVASRFLEKSFRRLPVVDEKGHLIGQISRRDALIAIESIRDNSYLYGSRDLSLNREEVHGVDSAMRRARGHNQRDEVFEFRVKSSSGPRRDPS